MNQQDLIQRAAHDLLNSKYAIALTGAGMSTESGIPDFRGPDGVWTKNPEAERESYEAYDELIRDPKAHWERMLTPGSFFGLLDGILSALPNAGHGALADLEKLGIMKMVITQNVDGLHSKAGTKNLVEYHGGLLKLRCMSCGARYDRDQSFLLKLKEENKLPPRCNNCNGVLKSDGVYFREPIPRDVYNQSFESALKCDLMLICGTSAVVYPFAELPRIARENKAGVVIVEVNNEPTPLTHSRISDYLIKGKTGDILPSIVAEVSRQKS